MTALLIVIGIVVLLGVVAVVMYDTVNRSNTKIQTLPSAPIAGMFHFTEREYFEAEGDARGPVVTF